MTLILVGQIVILVMLAGIVSGNVVLFVILRRHKRQHEAMSRDSEVLARDMEALTRSLSDLEELERRARH